MLKIKKISYEICKYGPAIAHPVISIEMEPVEDDSSAPALFDEFKELIKKNKLEDAYSRAIDGHLETYFIFKGDIFEGSSILDYETLMNKISIESADKQKDLIAQGKMTTDKLRPPFFMWEGVPKHFTKVAHSDKNDWRLSAYDDFNIPYAILTKDCDYSPIALQQLMNNTFGTVFVVWEDETSKDLIEEIRETFHGFKVFILSSKTNWKAAEKFALANGYSVYLKY